MTSRLLVRGGTVVVPRGEPIRADVLIENGHIAEIATDLPDTGVDEIVEAADCHVLPGFIDPHVHMGIYRSFADDMSSETTAAAHGGVTTVMVFAKILSLRTQEESYLGVLPELRELVTERADVNVGFHLALSTRQHIDELASCRAEGIRSFKMYMGYRADPDARKRGSVGVDDGYIFEAMRHIATLEDAVAMVHCENSEIANSLAEQGPREPWTFKDWAQTRPPLLEEEALQRSLLFAAETRCPFYGVHISSAAGLRAATRMHSEMRAPVYLEANLHHLLLTSDEAMEMTPPSLAKVSPPLRSAADVEALWGALGDGRLLTLGTDHACLEEELKAGDAREGKAGFPTLDSFGELFVSAALDRGLTMSQIATICSANPARIFGLHPRKGALLVGSDADVVVLRTDRPHRVSAADNRSFSKFSPYDGKPSQVAVEATIVGGSIVFQTDRSPAEQRVGTWVHRTEA